jgi:hypothetical protein
MSIKSAIEKSKDDNLKPSQKSYAGIDLTITIIKATDILRKKNKSDSEKRLSQAELKTEKINEVFKLENSKKAGITLWQLRDMFNDMGFNCDVLMSHHFYSDMTSVCNIKGYIIPFYENLVKFITRKNKKYQKLLLYKLAPGKSRLHVRMFDCGNGSWYVTSHVDEVNILNIFQPFKMLQSHSQTGQGDFILGTAILKEMLLALKESILNDKIFDLDINKLVEKKTKGFSK